MLRGYRFLIAAAFGLSLLCAAGFGAYYGALYSPANKQYQAIDTGQPTGKTYQGVTESLPDIALIPEPVERAIANPPPNSGEDHEKRDLAAQESMAAWAFYMTLFAGVSSLVTLIGTILIWQQVSLTRQAVEDTGNATDAMIESNSIAKETQRPWVVVSGVEYTGFNGVSPEGQQVGNGRIIRIIFKNSGLSPAVIRQVNRQYVIVPFEHNSNIDFPTISDEGGNIIGICGPGTGVMTDGILLDDAATTLFRSQTTKIIVNVVVYYRSTFDDAGSSVRITENTISVLYAGKSYGEGGATEGVQHVLVGTQNRCT